MSVKFSLGSHMHPNTPLVKITVVIDDRMYLLVKSSALVNCQFIVTGKTYGLGPRRITDRVVHPDLTPSLPAVSEESCNSWP